MRPYGRVLSTWFIFVSRRVEVPQLGMDWEVWALPTLFVHIVDRSGRSFHPSVRMCARDGKMKRKAENRTEMQRRFRSCGVDGSVFPSASEEVVG